MAELAGVEVRSRRELSIVVILVAIGAALKLYLEERVFSLRDMTLGTLDAEVLPFQRIGRGGVELCRECRRLEAVHGMAGRALHTSGPFGELAAMRIGLVAIHALGEGDRLLEISACMASRTIHSRVFPLQRILGFRMIEVPIHRNQRNSLPAFGVMARLTALRKTAVVHVRMAIRTLGKRYARIARLGVGARRVALFTLHLGMRSG